MEFGGAVSRPEVAEAESMHKLYHFPLCPFSRKVRLLMAEKGIETQLIEERYWERRPEFIRFNPSGKVPVLKANGTFLSDSQAICEFIDETVPESPLLPGDALARAEVRRLVFWFDGKFHDDVTSKLVYERVNKVYMGRGCPDSQNVKAGMDGMKFHLGYMERLLEIRRWLAGDRMTLADFAAAGHLSCLDYVNDVKWDRFPNVKDWYVKIKSRPAFRPVLADQVPGFLPPPQYADLDF